MSTQDLEALFGGKKSSPFKSELEIFKKFPSRLEFAIEGLSGSKLKWKPNPKQFSIREMICHLVDMESLGLANMNAIIASPENEPPKLLSFDTTMLASRLEYNDQDELLALQTLKYFRKYLSDILKLVPDTMTEKKGLLAKNKTTTLMEILQEHNKHAEKHLKDIERLKEEFGERE